MFRIQHYFIGSLFLLSPLLVNAGLVKQIDFESETVGSLPTTSSTDNSQIDSIRFGDPTIRREGNGNKYLEFTGNDPVQGSNGAQYDQVVIEKYAYTDKVQFSFDLFLNDTNSRWGDSAVLFFDNPTIQRYDFKRDISGNGTITAYNVDSTSRYIDSNGSVSYSNIYRNIYDVGLLDLTEWNNFMFDIDYSKDTVDVLINGVLAFTDTIFADSNSYRYNQIRFSTGTSYGIDNINLKSVASVSEPSTLFLLGLGLYGSLAMRNRKKKGKQF